MNPELVTSLSPEMFRQRLRGKKMVLFYPQTTYRTLFLSYFLAQNPSGLLYHRVAEGQTNLTTWLSGLVAEFDGDLGNFGTHLKSALETNDPAKMGEALAADLDSCRKKGETLVLFVDEVDRIPADSAFHDFIMALAAALPQDAQVVFNGRELTHSPWYELITRGEAVVFGRERTPDEGMFTLPYTAQPHLEVYAFGRGRTLVNGQLITNWDGALPRNLFFFFMDRLMATRAEIFQIFWSQLSVKEATNVYHVTKRKINERIGMNLNPDESADLTQYHAGFYIPSDNLVRHYDVGAFQTAVERAMATDDEDEEEMLLKQAVEIYKGPFLQDTTMPWIVERREQLHRLNAQALIRLGQLNHQRGDLECALGYFTRALKETPDREDVHRHVMEIYHQLGRSEDAKAQYQALAELLKRTLNIKPSAETRKLYEGIGKS
jgi:DNA-binding SARP family transcriptional activator